MEGRSTREALWKKKYDDALKFSYRLILQKKIIKEYFQIRLESAFNNSVSLTIIDRLILLLHKEKESLLKEGKEGNEAKEAKEGNERTENNIEDLFQETFKIANFNINEIQIQSISVSFSDILSWFRNYAHGYVKIVRFDSTQLSNSLYIYNVDQNLVKKVFLLINKVFISLDCPFDLTCEYNPIKELFTFILQTKENNENNENNLDKFLSEARNLMNFDEVITDELNETTVDLYICICLCQCMFGDFQKVPNGYEISFISTRYSRTDSANPEETASPNEYTDETQAPNESITLPYKEEKEKQPEGKGKQPESISPGPTDHKDVNKINETVNKKTLDGKILNILLVDDNAALQSVFKKFWQRKKQNVIIASNGQNAIDQIKSQSQNISIVFSDIEMPIKDGLTMVREIREWEAQTGRPHLPIIGLSGFQMKHYQTKALESGMDAFISKAEGLQLDSIYNIVVEKCG